MELLVNGVAAATSMTGGDGRAFLPFIPKGKDIVPVQVRVGASPRVSAAEAHANLVVWERRTPMLVVELSSLIEDARPEGPLSGIGSGLQQDLKPMRRCRRGTGQTEPVLLRDHLCRDGAFGSRRICHQRWTPGTGLQRTNFLRGFVLALSPGEDALGAKIDELHQAGWKTVKTGIGRSKVFVETFLRRRLEAIIVPEPSTGRYLERPRWRKTGKTCEKNCSGRPYPSCPRSRLPSPSFGVSFPLL